MWVATVCRWQAALAIWTRRNVPGRVMFGCSSIQKNSNQRFILPREKTMSKVRKSMTLVIRIHSNGGEMLRRYDGESAYLKRNREMPLSFPSTITPSIQRKMNGFDKDCIRIGSEGWYTVPGKTKRIKGHSKWNFQIDIPLYAMKFCFGIDPVFYDELFIDFVIDHFEVLKIISSVSVFCGARAAYGIPVRQYRLVFTGIISSN